MANADYQGGSIKEDIAVSGPRGLASFQDLWILCEVKLL
jgi:hypothetical protein